MKVNFDKNNDGLVPAIVQDALTKNVLMLGYMNEEALQKTQETQKVTFYSRTKKRLWTKGEESGNFLHLVDIQNDCDDDTLLVLVRPAGQPATGVPVPVGAGRTTPILAFFQNWKALSNKDGPRRIPVPPT